MEPAVGAVRARIIVSGAQSRGSFLTVEGERSESNPLATTPTPDELSRSLVADPDPAANALVRIAAVR